MDIKGLSKILNNLNIKSLLDIELRLNIKLILDVVAILTIEVTWNIKIKTILATVIPSKFDPNRTVYWN